VPWALNFNTTGEFHMKKNILALILTVAFIGPALADKPVWAGKGKPSDEQKAAHQSAMEAKEDLDNEVEIKERKDKSDKLKGLEKQKTKKSEQVQKELDKGSDKGQESRESHSKKWWKFWGE